MKLKEWFFIKGYRVKGVSSDAGLCEAVADRVVGEVCVVFFPGEAFLLGGGDELALIKKAGGGVVIITTNSQDFH
jgi:hypothetical protein